MNWKIMILLILAAIGLAILVGAVTNASAIRIGQGEYVYMNETNDLSLALSWPDFAVAWCNGGDYGCVPPAQVITIEGYQHAVYIDPAVYHYGTYYRWDGHWNSAEYAVAFVVGRGSRPVPLNATIPTNVTNQTPDINVTAEGPHDYIIARGDIPTISTISHLKNVETAHLWMFGTTDLLLNIPLEQEGDAYFWRPNISETSALSDTKYTGFIQFNGNNQLQDVFTNPSETEYESPYDDALVPDVVMIKHNTMWMQSKFTEMVGDAKYSDDILVPVTLTVVDPQIVIDDMFQNGDAMVIGGRTTWSSGTVITIKLDPDNYALASDVEKHTWRTAASGNINTWRTFSQSVPIIYDELALGPHTLEMSVEKNVYVTKAYHDFRVTDTFVMPTQTPVKQKYIADKNGTVIAVQTSVTPTPIPTPTPTPEPTRIVRPQNLTVTTPVPNSTQNTNGNSTSLYVPPPPTQRPVPTATTSNDIVVPLPWYLGLLAIPIVWGFKR